MQAQLDRLQNLCSPWEPDKKIMVTGFRDQWIKHIFNGEDISGHNQVKSPTCPLDKSHTIRMILKLQRCIFNNYSPQVQ